MRHANSQTLSSGQAAAQRSSNGGEKTGLAHADEPEEATRSARHGLDRLATGEAAAESDLDASAILTLYPKTSLWTVVGRRDCQSGHSPLGSTSSRV